MATYKPQYGIKYGSDCLTIENETTNDCLNELRRFAEYVSKLDIRNMDKFAIEFDQFYLLFTHMIEMVTDKLMNYELELKLMNEQLIRVKNQNKQIIEEAEQSYNDMSVISVQKPDNNDYYRLSYEPRDNSVQLKNELSVDGDPIDEYTQTDNYGVDCMIQTTILLTDEFDEDLCGRKYEETVHDKMLDLNGSFNVSISSLNAELVTFKDSSVGYIDDDLNEYDNYLDSSLSDDSHTSLPNMLARNFSLYSNQVDNKSIETQTVNVQLHDVETQSEFDVLKLAENRDEILLELNKFKDVTMQLINQKKEMKHKYTDLKERYTKLKQSF